MQRVAIVGLGLIGGSIGLGLRRWSTQQAKGSQEALEVVGFDSDLEQQQYAKKIGAVDRAEWELAKAIRDADVVVVCTPVRAMEETFRDIAPLLKSGAVVTDVGSTKSQVLEWAATLLPRTVGFVGGHPMAGKAMSIEGAEADLFQGATWCIAPSLYANDEAVRNVIGMVTALGAEAYFVDPAEHDAYVAGVSHLPFVLSATLVSTLAADPSWRDMKTLTAGGFRDMTRLAGANPDVHRDIVLTNRDSVRRWVDAYRGRLDAFAAWLDAPDDEASAGLAAFFEQARDHRAEWATQTTREGALLQDTGGDLAREGFGDQMGRMLFGSFLRRRPGPTERVPRTSSAESDQGSKDGQPGSR